MLVVRSHNRVPVRLTEERWQHIVHRHSEMVNQREHALETLVEPDLIQRGDFGELLAVRFYPETTLTRKFLVVVYREIGPEDGCILTAYLTSRPSARRETIWKR